MDGGEVSTNSVGYLIKKLHMEPFAHIDSKGFYIYNFPGMMELAALFRPHAVIQEGLIRSLTFPGNTFYVHEPSNLILFLGKEPNLDWERYTQCISELSSTFGVTMIYFIGSVSSLVPHTREPRLLCTASNKEILERFQHYGVKFTNYEGPASIVTYLTHACTQQHLGMISLVATIPAYVQGNNPKCIEAVTRRLVGMLGIDINLNDLRTTSEEFERKLGEVVREQPELANSIGKLEEDYDNEIFNSEMGELKSWLQQKGIRLD
jgi:proteasome assembly chaperone (PAC2) family protein